MIVHVRGDGCLEEGGSKGDTQIWVDSHNKCIRNLTFSYIQWESISKRNQGSFPSSLL